MNAIVQAIAAVVLPLLAGFLAKEVAKGVGAINALTGVVGTIVKGLIGIVFTAVAAAVVQKFPGLVLPGDLGGFNQDAILAVLSFFVQLLFPVQAMFARARVARGLNAH